MRQNFPQLQSLNVWCLCILALAGCKENATRYGLIIGDSHAATPGGWADQLHELRPQDSIFNLAISGNTIGFDNLGKKELNTLRNIYYQLARADNVLPRIDYIVILIGTNDCKAIFDSLQSRVPENLDKLVSVVRNYNFIGNSLPDIVLVTPPPVAEDEQMEEKYAGARRRLQNLLPHFERIAARYGCRYLDIHTQLQPDFASLTPDGIHLTTDGYDLIAHMIAEKLDEQ